MSKPVISDQYYSARFSQKINHQERNKKIIKKDHKRFCRNLSAEFNPNNHFYSTLNSSIKYIADIVYQEVGEGPGNNQMSFSNFKIWISRNEGILKTFDKWLRKNIWGGSLSNQENSSGFLCGYTKVNMKLKSRRFKSYKKMYLELNTNILMIYTNSSKKNLLNLYILKDLRMKFDSKKFKIKIFHEKSTRYMNLTLIFENKQKFETWQQAFKPFVQESVEKFYRFRGKIGRGTFSTVNLVEEIIDSKKQFDVKIIEKDSLTSTERKLISEEAKIISKLNHEYIVKFHQNYEDYRRIYYVFELVNGGDLFEYVLSKGRLSESEARRVFRQLLKVMKYLHAHNILHRDLKPENIMIEKDEIKKEIRNIKLIDFGFATFFSKDSLPSDSCGTLNYAAPEVLLGEEYDEMSDLFSCGVILYFM